MISFALHGSKLLPNFAVAGSPGRPDSTPAVPIATTHLRPLLILSSASILLCRRCVGRTDLTDLTPSYF